MQPNLVETLENISFVPAAFANIATAASVSRRHALKLARLLVTEADWAIWGEKFPEHQMPQSGACAVLRFVGVALPCGDEDEGGVAKRLWRLKTSRGEAGCPTLAHN